LVFCFLETNLVTILKLLILQQQLPKAFCVQKFNFLLTTQVISLGNLTSFSASIVATW
jgi:hypothetical protein